MERGIIDNYHDLMLGDYEKIVKICKDESLEEIDKQIQFITILTGMKEKEVLALPINEYRALASRTRFLEQPLPDVSARLPKSYEIGAFKLIPVIDIRKVTTAQYIDYQSFHQAGLDEHLTEILSCLLVPKGKIYCDGYEIVDVQKAIRDNMSVHDALSLYAFFLLSFNKSIKDTLTFLESEIKQIPNESKKMEMQSRMEALRTTLTNGVG